MGSSTSSSMPMSGHHGTMMGMDAMAMTFFTSTGTPLFSMPWTPMTTGQYAGTCIFLIALAAICRGLLAVRAHIFDIFASLKRGRYEKPGFAPHIAADGTTRPWRASEAVVVGTMDTIIAGVGYLL